LRRIDLKKASAARINTIRDINRQIVLNYVRERAPISRAEIASETALQRSTISTIVEELKSEGLVEEMVGESTGGRPPSLLYLRSGGAFAIGVDVGTTETVVARCDLAGRALEQETFITDPDAFRTLEKISEAIARLSNSVGGQIEGVGISVPGLVDWGTGEVIFVPRFKWRNLDVSRLLSERTGLPVTVDNDANATALAELWFGRPEVQDVRDFIVVLIEGGVGTGIVFDGQVYRGKRGAAGEFGHMTIGTGAPVACASGSRECWEAFASERAALARYDNLIGKSSKASRDVSFKHLVDLALEGDEAAQTALEETAHYVGVGISNLIMGLSPEAVIVGGEMARAWPVVVQRLRRSVEGSGICGDLSAGMVMVSTLGDQPRLMGAFSLVLASIFAAPVPA
jgi:predicted NBD/HSP70 family sugar kinase